MQIYNSLTKQKENFEPLRPNHIGLYVCGVTVYDDCHIGHARTYFAFDSIVRYLRYIGWSVRYIRNVTDIDDKIIKRANENNTTADKIAAKYIHSMNEDFKALNLLVPDKEPLVTHYIDKIIAMVKNLIDKNFAYVAKNGDVYFRVRNFEKYGCVSYKSIDELQAGSRVEVNDAKEDPLDFVLWKMAKAGEPSFESPWGNGRPGWHIECSVMATDTLGDTFDLHGGGSDLKFPHHENENAQSVCSTGKEFVKTWMHVGFLNINEEKMSKSLNNFLTIKDVLKEVDPETLRYFMISSHYRSQVEYSDDNIQKARASIVRLYTALRGLDELVFKEENTAYEENFIKAMDDDFHTPNALAVLFDLAREINSIKETDKKRAANLGYLLKELGNSLGLLMDSPEEYLKRGASNHSEIDDLIAKRNQARANKDFVLADKIRAQLDNMGIVLEDKDGKTSWSHRT